MAKLNICFTLVAIGVVFLALCQRRLDNSFWSLILTHYHDFTFDDIPDMSEKVILVTGANSGLGYVSSRELARKGGHVIMACRSEKRARAAMARIRKEVGTVKLDFLPLDLGDFQSTENAVTLIKEKYKRLDVLMANAGVEDPNFLHLDGMERPMRINHLGHFQLVTGLEDLILAATNPRIVILSSNAHRWGGNVLDQSWNREIKPSDSWLPTYWMFHTYGRSKLANILFASELQNRLEKRNPTVFVNSAHPGAVATNMGSRFADKIIDEYFFGIFKGKYVAKIVEVIYSLIFFTVDDGALTQLYLASSPEVVKNGFKGEYFIPHGVRALPSEWARNRRKQQELWEWSEDELERLSLE